MQIYMIHVKWTILGYVDSLSISWLLQFNYGLTTIISKYDYNTLLLSIICFII